MHFMFNCSTYTLTLYNVHENSQKCNVLYNVCTLQLQDRFAKGIFLILSCFTS